MWNPGDQVPPVYHHSKDSSHGGYPQWDRYQVADHLDQQPPPDQGLVDFSSDLPADMQHHHRDTERPFKAYPRTPVSLPGSFYGSPPYPTAIYASQMGPGGTPGYSSVSPTCNSPTIPSMPGGSKSGIVHHHHHHHIAMHSSSTTQPSRSPPQAHSSTPSHRMMDITSTMPSLKNEAESRERLDIQKNDDGFSTSSRSSPSSPIPSSSQDDDSVDRFKHEDGIRMPPKKRPHIMPELQKDGSYWDKRKKNNESAKRSREARRMKEEQIAVRVVYLEQENLQLRTELSILKSEIEKLQCMLYNS